MSLKILNISDLPKVLDLCNNSRNLFNLQTTGNYDNKEYFIKALQSKWHYNVGWF